MELPVDSPLLQNPLKMAPDLVETPVAEQPQGSAIRGAIRGAIRISEAGNDNGDDDNVVLFDASAASRSSTKSSTSMNFQTEAAQNAVKQNELPVSTYDDSHIVEEEEEEECEGQAERQAPSIMKFDAFVTGELSFLPAADENEVIGSECEEDNLTESRDDDNGYSQCTLGTPDDEEEVDFDYDTFKDAFDGDDNDNDNDSDGDQPALRRPRVSLTSISSKLVLGVREKTQQVAQSKKQALSNFQKKGGLVGWLHGELPDGSSDPDYYDEDDDGMDESSGTTTQLGALPQVAPGIPGDEDALRSASLPPDPIASPSSQQEATSRQHRSFPTQQHQRESAPAVTTFLKKSLGRQRASSLLENLYGKVKKSTSLSPAATPPRSPTRSGGSGGDRSLPDSPASAVGGGEGRIALQPSPRKGSAKDLYSFGFEDFGASDVKDDKASGIRDLRQRMVSADSPPPKSTQQQASTRTRMSWSSPTSVSSPTPSPEPISAIRETEHLLLHECLADPKLAAEFVNTVMPDDSALLKLLYSIEEYGALVATTMTTSESMTSALSVQVTYATTVIDKFLTSQPNSTMSRSSSALSKLPASTPTDLKYTIEQFQLANAPALPKSLFKDVYEVVYDALRDGYEAFRSTREYALLLEQQAFQHERGIGLNANNNGNNGNNVMTLDAILKSEWCCTVFWMHLYRTAHHHRLSFLMEKTFKLDRLYQEFLETREPKVPDDVSTAGAGASATESYSRLAAQLKLVARKFLHTTAPVALPVAAVSLCRLKEEICVEITHLPLSSALHQGDGNDNDNVCVAAIERAMGKLDAFAFDVQKEFKRLSFERFASFTASSLYRDFISQLLQPPSVGSQAEMGVGATVRGDIVQLLRASRIPFHQAPNEVPQALDLSSLLGTPDDSSSSSSTETEVASDAIYKVFSFVKRDVINAQKRTQPYEFMGLVDNGDHNEAVDEEQKPSQDALLYQMVERFLIPEAAPRTFQISDTEAQQRLCFNFVAGNSENSVYGAVWRMPLAQSDGTTMQGICVLSKYPLVDSLRHYLWRFAQRKMNDGANSATASGVLSGNLSSAFDEANAAFETYFAGQHQQIPTQPIMEANNSGKLQALPRVDFSLEDLFDCLSITHILRLVSFVLLEKKIVLVSSSYSVLLSVGEALKSLIYPLAWSHIYVPVLPLALKGYLHCPTPFIFGLHNSYVRNSELPRPSDDLVVVNLDRDSLTGGGDVFLPPTRDASIRDKLTRICRPRLQTRDQIDFYPGGENESLSSKGSVKPKVFPSQAIRSVFHEELREMLAGLEMFAFRFEFNDKFVTVVDSSNKSRVWASDSLRFNATLLQTQAFSAHLSSLSNLSSFDILDSSSNGGISPMLAKLRYRIYPRVNCIAPTNIIIVHASSKCKIEPRRMSLLCDYSDSSSASSDDDDEQATAPQLIPAVQRAQQQIVRRVTVITAMQQYTLLLLLASLLTAKCLFVQTSCHPQSLPSAEELFASDTSLSLTSSNNINTQYRVTSSSSSVSTFVGSTGQNDAAKRRLQEQELSATKRLKPTTTSGSNSSSSTATAAKKPVTRFAPPQLKRPNVSTEDLGAWNTQKTLAMQRKAKSQHADP